jgi:hypothetical protein
MFSLWLLTILQVQILMFRSPLNLVVIFAAELFYQRRRLVVCVSGPCVGLLPWLAALAQQHEGRQGTSGMYVARIETMFVGTTILCQLPTPSWQHLAKGNAELQVLGRISAASGKTLEAAGNMAGQRSGCMEYPY